jgi:hypothetical protein
MKGIATVRLADVLFAKRSYTGAKHMASARKKSSSKGQSTPNRRVSSHTASTSRSARASQARRAAKLRFAICVKNDDYRASLELRKLYPVLKDEFAANHDMIRVVDESGEDYLYPSSYFVRVELPQSVEQMLRKIA